MTDEMGNPSEWAIEEVYEARYLPEPVVPVLTAQDKDMRVAVGIPMERTMQQEAFFGFVGIFQQGWGFAQLAYTRNDIARHKLAKFLLDGDYTHLLMLDSDHIHPPDIVARLARWFQAYPNEVRVVGGLNFRRGAPYDPCAFVDPGDGQFHRLSEWEGHDEQGAPVRGAVSVDALGTGSMMIARDVFEQLPEADGWFDYSYADRNGWPGTDMTFSAKCKAAGIELWCDTTCTSPHIGAMMITEETYRVFLAQQMALAKQQRAAASMPQVVTI